MNQLSKNLISKSGKDISVLIFESSKKPQLTVIESHGGITNSAENTANENKKLIDYFLEKNINYIAINFSNNGTQSDQPPQEVIFSDRIKDLESVIDFATNEYNCPIILLGSSLGGHTTINAANYSNFIKGLILNCPALKADESVKNSMDKNQFDNWKQNGKAQVFEGILPYKFYEDLKNNQAIKKIPDLKIPVLIFHGTADNVVSIEQSREAKKLNSNIELIEVEDGSHRFGNKMKPGEWEEKINEFITRVVNC